MNRRIFLQKVSDLAKGSVAAITLSKIQIAAVATSLATVSCEKENPLKNSTEGIEKNAGLEFCDQKTILCGNYGFNCTTSNDNCNKVDFTCNPYSGYYFNCLSNFICTTYHCNRGYSGAVGGT
jgi:hypothetical protein